MQSVLTEERTSLMQEITNLVNQGAEPLGLKVVDVRIKRADLPTENSEAIFRRMQAERDREAREFRAQGEEQATRIKANADREKAVLLAEANRDSRLFAEKVMQNVTPYLLKHLARIRNFLIFIDQC